MGVWQQQEQPVVPDTEHALHYAVLKSAMMSALVGQFRHHFPDDDLPSELEAADRQAFDAATTQCELGAGTASGPLYDLVEVTRLAFTAGQEHRDGECPFCEPVDVDELAASAVADAGARALAAVG